MRVQNERNCISRLIKKKTGCKNVEQDNKCHQELLYFSRLKSKTKECNIQNHPCEIVYVQYLR